MLTLSPSLDAKYPPQIPARIETLMLLEMNSTLHWVKIVWGTLEGWWLFEDGRTHAVVDERQWEKDWPDASYKTCWSGPMGSYPKCVQRVIIALADDVERNVGRLLPCRQATS